ncbi:tyrosine-protein phosphatase [Granulosicoccaceae sp. 1_MG-2023]|nr:tyrosine-protein phosphatase [Granulosicoccaceae sp. 1_MG-2023]
MSTHPFDILPLPDGAAFIFTPCPGTRGSSLSDSLQTLKDAGADGLVCMLSDAELAQLSVPSLGAGVRALGMRWFQLPVTDDAAPEARFEQAWDAQRAALLAMLEAKQTLVIHCRGGTGRTGMMAALLLLERGYDWQESRRLVQSVRPKALTLAPHLDYISARYGI